MPTTARRRDARGRYIRTYTIRWEQALPGRPDRTITRAGRTARQIEILGTALTRWPEDQVFNIAVLDSHGDDVTFDFKCFQTTGGQRECPTCAAPADKTGTRIPEHRPGCPCTVDYRAV
jgi:hypothetical protein